MTDFSFFFILSSREVVCIHHRHAHLDAGPAFFIVDIYTFFLVNFVLVYIIISFYIESMFSYTPSVSLFDKNLEFLFWWRPHLASLITKNSVRKF